MLILNVLYVVFKLSINSRPDLVLISYVQSLYNYQVSFVRLICFYGHNCPGEVCDLDEGFGVAKHLSKFKFLENREVELVTAAA